MRPQLSHPKTRTFRSATKPTPARPPAPSTPHRFIALPGNAASGAQRSTAHSQGLAGCAGGCGLAGRGGRSSERASARRTGRDEAPARPRRSSRPPATHVRRGGLPGADRVRAAKCAQLTQLPEWAGGQAGRGTSRAHDAAEGPTWRSPGHGAELNEAAARRAPQRVPGGADAEAPQLTTSPGRGGGSRRPSSALRAGELAGARAQAVDRRNRRAQQPKELEPERAGPRRPSPGQRPRRARAPPQCRSTCNGPPGFGEGRGAARGPHLGPGG